MELEHILREPQLRRCWLLSKALESAPLEDAVRLAQVADCFLAGHEPPGDAVSGLRGESRRLASLDWKIQPLIAPPHGEAADKAPAANGTANHRPLTEYVIAGAANGHAETGPKEADPAAAETNDGDAAPADGEPAPAGDLAVLATIDDIVRYLRQRDDVVVSAGEGLYLVNGRFRITRDELLSRANKMRQRQGKPPFQHFPASLSRTNGTGTNGVIPSVAGGIAK